MISSRICVALSYAKASSNPIAAAIRAISIQSGIASPGASTTGCTSVRLRSELIMMPSVSDHIAAGSAMSAYAFVSVSANASWVITSSAASNPAITVLRLPTEATGLVQMIQQALIRPAAICSNISTVPLPTSVRSVPPGSPQTRSVNSRSAGTSTER